MTTSFAHLHHLVLATLIDFYTETGLEVPSVPQMEELIKRLTNIFEEGKG